MFFRRYRELWTGLAAVTAFIAVMACLRVGGWPGKPSSCLVSGGCDCETAGNGLIVQPANTLSTIGFIVVGLTILGSIGVARGRAGSGSGISNPMRSNAAYPTTYAAAALLLGFGSSALHASTTEWGGWLDLVAMHAFILLLLSYNLGRLLGWPYRRLLFTLGVSITALAAIQWPLDNSAGTFVFGALVLLTVAAELALAGRFGRFSRDPPLTRDRRWLWGSLLGYGVGSVLWLLSRTDGALCSPDSLLQGHALWHLIAAGVVALLYLYLRSENSPGERVPRSREELV